MENNEYFFIDYEFIKGKTIFPFHIFLYNPSNGKYAPFIYANSPLTKDKKQFLEFVLNKNGKIAIPKSQARTFLRSQDLDENDVPGLTTAPLSEEEQEREQDLKILEMSRKDKGYQFSSELKKAIETDDFLPLILEARKEIVCFSLKISHSVSLSVHLAKTLMEKDSFNNRVVAVSYFVAKLLNIKSEKDLSDLVNASFLYHLGYSQVELDCSRKKLLDLDSEQRRRFQRHPGLTLHLLRKSKLDVSDRVTQIIAQHHERVDGTGYPDNKKAEHIDNLALILGAVSFIFEWNSGKIGDGQKSIPRLIHSMKNKNIMAGLEFEFGDTIIETLFHIFNDEKERLAS